MDLNQSNAAGSATYPRNSSGYLNVQGFAVVRDAHLLVFRYKSIKIQPLTKRTIFGAEAALVDDTNATSERASRTGNK